MKFQNISIHSSELMLCTRKRDKDQTNVMNEQKARSNMPPSWGHNKYKWTANTDDDELHLFHHYLSRIKVTMG